MRLVGHVANVAVQVGLPTLPREWRGVDVVWPLLQKMKAEGAVVLLKLDGERGEGDNGPYTALVSGASLGSDAIRTDAATVEDALSYIICHYAAQVWGAPLPASEVR